jgi:hypothetical protein
MKLRRLSLLVTCATFFLSSPASAVEVVLDGITPQITVVGPYGLTTSNWGTGFIAGESRELVQIDIIVDRQAAINSVVGRLYKNASNGISGSGTFIAEFTQSSAASTSILSRSDAYIAKLTGSAQLIAGEKYWVYFTRVDVSNSTNHWWVPTTPTVSGSWSIMKSGSDYLMTSSSSNFPNSNYPSFRLVVSTPTTINVSLSAGGSQATYRSTTTIRAAVNSNGPVTFYANRKYIPGCKAVQSSAGVATCQWKPSLHGVVRLSARVVPTDSANYAPKTSDDFQVRTVTRTTRR